MKTKSLWMGVAVGIFVGAATGAVAFGQEVDEALINDVAGELKVLDRLVGTWNDDVTSRATEFNPKEAKLTGVTTSEWVLGRRFLQTKSRRQPGGQEALVLSTYDPAKRAYRSWFFNSQGATNQWTGQWDEKSQTLAGTIDFRPGVTGTRETRFTDKDTLQWTVVAKGQDGKVFFDLTAKSVRGTGAADKPAAADKGNEEQTGPVVPKPPELKALDAFAGSWETEAVAKPAEWTPQETRTKGVEENQWVLDGRFLQINAGADARRPETIFMFTYDARQSEYRCWQFGSPGYVNELSGQWDEGSQSFSWKGDLGNGITTTGPSHIIDKDTRDFHVVAKDAGGKVYFDIEGKLRRKK